MRGRVGGGVRGRVGGGVRGRRVGGGVRGRRVGGGVRGRRVGGGVGVVAHCTFSDLLPPPFQEEGSLLSQTVPAVGSQWLSAWTEN